MLLAASAEGGTAYVVLMLPILVLVLLLVFIICILICRALAREKSLPSSYMWFGLFSILGILMVAWMPRGKSPAEKLIEQKQLLDMQIITQEAFEQAKSELLSPGR